MYTARQFLSKKALLMLYHAYIYLYMTYCIEVWGCAFQNSIQLCIVASKENNEFLSLLSIDLYQSTFPFNGSPSFKEFFFLYKVGLIMYKYSLKLLLECIAHLYLRNDSIHEHNTRGCHKLKVVVVVVVCPQCERGMS